MTRPSEENDWFGDLRPMLDDDLASFVANNDRHRSLTVVTDPRDVDAEGKTRRWLDRLRVDPATTGLCTAMQRVVEKHADGSRDGQLRGALAAVRLDELGHVGVAAALDELWGVRAKDRRDFDRVVMFARRRVVESPSPLDRHGCRCARSASASDPPGTPTTGDAAAGDDSEDEPKGSVSTRLVRMAEAGYELGCSPDGESFGVPRQGAVITHTLRGGRQSLRAELAHAFYREYGQVPSQGALADAIAVLEGKAQQEEPVSLNLRVARDGEDLVLDLGDATGRAVVLNARGWRITDQPPVLFRRTALTGALPEPVGGKDLDDVLWPHLNVAAKYRPLVASILVAELIPNMPHPVILLTGEQGCGKSTATSRLAAILDPAPAQVRKVPRDVEAWTTAASGSWVVALDNLSDIPDWLSDALCRASTGDGDVRRRLYSDGDLTVFAFRRCVIVNGIDVGAVRGDLADRLVHLALDRIAAAGRREDQELADEWARAHPEVLGALLDLTVRVLAALPTTKVQDPPRMADYARVLAAVDAVRGTSGLTTYRELGRDLAEDAATADPVLAALTKAITGEFTGTSGDLLTLLNATAAPQDDYGRPVEKWRPPKGWPTQARSLTATLKRRAPTLRTLGWTVEETGRGATRAKQVSWTIAPPRGQDPREGAEGAADAAFAANDESAQVSRGAVGAANGAARARQTADEPSSAANDQAPPQVAAPFAAPRAVPLTSANEDHAANAATAAPDTPSLRSVTWRVSGEPA